MPDFNAALAASHANFAAADVSAISPPPVGPEPVDTPADVPNLDVQAATGCAGDYNQMPYGWRQAPFMGQCGFKIQMKNFYSPSSPCYPVQDLSCMGPAQKQAWARMCSTEFPCKAPPLPVYPKPYLAPPGLFQKPAHHQASAWESFMQVANDSLPIIAAAGLGSCLLFSITKSNKSSDSDSEGSDSEA